MSFTTIVTGAQMKAADFNQYANQFNGATATSLAITQTNSTSTALTLTLPSVSAGANWLTVYSTSDSNARVALYINSGGFGGLAFGYGNAAAVGHMEATSSGWTFLQPLATSGPFTLTTGALTATHLSISAAASVGGNVTINSGAGTISGNATSIGAHATPTINGNNASSVYVTDDGSTIYLNANRVGTAARNLVLSSVSASNGVWPSLTAGSDGYVHSFWPWNLVVGSLSAMSTFAGTLTGTTAISHGLAATPATVIAASGSTGSPAAWTNCATSAYGNSTYTITPGASGFAIMAIAFIN